MEFHHAGIATHEATALADRYTAVFNAPIVHEESFDGMNVIFLELAAGYFELLEPREKGAVARYLDSHGAGIHHLALSTSDIESVLTRAANHGIDRIDDEPRPGAWGHEVAFLHPSSTGGVLIEVVAE